MLSVTIKSIMLSVIMLNVVALGRGLQFFYVSNNCRNVTTSDFHHNLIFVGKTRPIPLNCFHLDRHNSF